MNCRNMMGLMYLAMITPLAFLAQASAATEKTQTIEMKLQGDGLIADSDTPPPSLPKKLEYRALVSSISSDGKNGPYELRFSYPRDLKDPDSKSDLITIIVPSYPNLDQRKYGIFVETLEFLSNEAPFPFTKGPDPQKSIDTKRLWKYLTVSASRSMENEAAQKAKLLKPATREQANIPATEPKAAQVPARGSDAETPTSGETSGKLAR